jgi:holliday junction DNA helicase RuvA
MISFVRGILVEKNPGRITLDVHGLGLDLVCSTPTFASLPAAGSTVQLWSYLQVREDSWNLVGFATADEKELFLYLVSVSGVGIKLALSVLSNCPVADFYRLIAQGNEAALTGIPGLGRKMAQKIILELKDKTKGKVQAVQFRGMDQDLVSQTIQAMISLGYSRQEAVAAIERAGRSQQVFNSVETLLRAALQS